MTDIKFINEEGFEIQLKDYELEFPNGIENDAMCIVHTSGFIFLGYVDMILKECCCEDIVGIIIKIPNLKGIKMDHCRFCRDLFILEQYPENVNGDHLKSCPCRMK